MSLPSFSQYRKMRALTSLIQPKLDEVEAFFAREARQAVPIVGEVSGYVLGSGGKRLRPALVLLISRMLGYGGERDVRYAAVVELIHTATLIHDDIIDGADLRRGRPTASSKWGNQTSILVGDWMYTRTMELCLELGDVAVMRMLTGATLRMIEGEILADEARGSVDIDLETYRDITQRKTAELFAAACAVPALFQPQTLHHVEALENYGRRLGMCFQLVDDLLDFTSSRSEMGKPVMADLREGKVTLPILLLLERGDSRLRERIASVAASGQFEAISEEELLQVVRTSGVLDEVRVQAAEHARAASEALFPFSAGPEKELLQEAPELLLDRRN